MSDETGFRIIDTDEIDLAALRFVLREAEFRYRTIIERTLPSSVQAEYDRATDRDAAHAIGRLTGEACVRFEGEKAVTSNYREAKERVYAMYALHPDTAEQVLAAIEFLIKHQGPRLRFHTRPTRHEPKTTRNSSQQAGTDKERDAQ